MQPLQDGQYAIYDLESEHAHIPLQRDLLVRSLQAVPEVFLDWRTPFGREEARWVLFVPKTLDTSVATAVRTLCLEDPVYLCQLAASWRRAAARLKAVEVRLSRLLLAARQSARAGPCGLSRDRSLPAPGTSADWRELLEALAHVGAFAAVNWLVPTREMAEKVCASVSSGLSPLDLLVPSGLPLALQVERAQLLFIARVRGIPLTDPRTEAAPVKASEGKVPCAGRRVLDWYELSWACLVLEPFEEPPPVRRKRLERHMQDLLELDPSLWRRRWDELCVRRRNHFRRHRAVLARLQAPRAGVPTEGHLWALVAADFLRSITQQEEDRHVLRSRAFALLEWFAVRRGLDPMEMDWALVVKEAGTA
ncbi:MAG TPA: hypothetical protein DHW14_04255 [Clostridiales bacterium]|nr:hypothetical protein [Clostridiales bacterium]